MSGCTLRHLIGGFPPFVLFVYCLCFSQLAQLIFSSFHFLSQGLEQCHIAQIEGECFHAKKVLIDCFKCN